MNDCHRRRDRCREWVRITARLQDRRFLVVPDAAIDRLDEVAWPKLGDRAGEIVGRLSLSKRGPRQGGYQAQQEHRRIAHAVYRAVRLKFLSSWLVVNCSSDVRNRAVRRRGLDRAGVALAGRGLLH